MRRIARLAAVGIGVCAVIAASPSMTRAHGRLVTVARSLMPWAGLTAAPLALLARLGGRQTAAAAGVAVASASAAMCRPLLRRTTVQAANPALSVLHANLLSKNRHVTAAGVALAALDADVVTFTEYTPTHARHLKTTELADRYAHRVELTAPASRGTALWSRHPVTLRATLATTHHTVVADVHTPAGDVCVVVVHAQSPIAHHGDWLADLRQLGDLELAGPTIMTGDFNAGWWHPEFRALLRTWRDAHIVAGRGLSCSWPTERWHFLFRWHPPFVRLDHALVNDHLGVVDVLDLHVPGSDHLGLLVTVTPTCRSGHRAVP
jgi:endonuclease/exonuclease/phosphatase (EEP) superfamily protein YafD